MLPNPIPNPIPNSIYIYLKQHVASLIPSIIVQITLGTNSYYEEIQKYQINYIEI